MHTLGVIAKYASPLIDSDESIDQLIPSRGGFGYCAGALNPR
jgi:hypothetical protein